MDPVDSVKIIFRDHKSGPSLLIERKPGAYLEVGTTPGWVEVRRVVRNTDDITRGLFPDGLIRSSESWHFPADGVARVETIQEASCSEPRRTGEPAPG